jgi:UDP-galactopyranose mutase
MTAEQCYVIGAGLTGATCAWSLRQAGIRPTIVEAANVVGGHVRNEWFRGVPYEPNGAHIFHTSDEEVWKLASSLVEFVPYEHRVLTNVSGTTLSWPIQMDEIQSLREWPTIERQLANRPDTPDRSNFETWCVSIMGATLYEMFIEGYTTKQWGRPARELSADFAPKRVELRTDGHRGLFRDPYEGWPRTGYGSLVEALLDDSSIMLNTRVTARSLPEFVAPGVPVVVTAPLDGFFEEAAGPLEWRGVHLVPHWIPDTNLAQQAMVVNEPDAAIPYTRSIETKWVMPDMHDVEGTVVCYEYPGAPVKHHPVYDAAGTNRARQTRYTDMLQSFERNPLFAAGRLANYLYINMDEAMRQGLDAAQRVLRSIPN